MVKVHSLILGALSCVAMISCSDGGATTADAEVTGALCDEPPAERWVSAEGVDPALRRVGDGQMLEAVGVRALRGCEDLDGPLAAMNWWTIQDPETNAAYGSVVGPLLMQMGANVLFNASGPTVIQVPDGTAPDGSSWLQDTLTIPLYPSAEAFAGMLASEAWLEVGGYKLEETEPADVDFVFMRCLFGCEAIQDTGDFLAVPQEPTLVMLFNGSREELDATLAPLQDALLASGLGQLFFAGYAWARPAIRLEEVATVASESKSFWNDGLVILTLAGEDSVEALLQLEAWVSLMAVTQNHTLVHFPAP